MASTRVSKFARSDKDSGCVLIQATPKGTKPLDLRLVATESAAAYVVTLKHDRVSSLRVKNCPASEDEWQAILESLLNQEPLPDIQASATVQEKSSVSITVRKQVQGITQRLGAITLNHDPYEEIQLFEWCEAAAQASYDNRNEVADSAATTRNLKSNVKELTAQLDELVQAKADDETVMLQKFRDLLNEKKVKIREQQKILDTKVSNSSFPAPPQPSQSPAPQPARNPAKSRPAKRKATQKTVEESDDDEGFQRMDVDKVKSEPDDTDGGNTTDRTASTASDNDAEEEEGDAGATAPPPPPPKKAAAQPPPPRRNLTFANRKPAQASAAPAQAVAGSETESDDEL